MDSELKKIIEEIYDCKIISSEFTMSNDSIIWDVEMIPNKPVEFIQTNITIENNEQKKQTRESR